MVKCNNCKNLETKDNGFDAYSWCEKINDCPHEDIERDCEHYSPMTNADRIRSMTDKELAMALLCVLRNLRKKARLAMTENEAIKELETSIDLAKMCTQNYERKNEIQGYEMAIKALEEVQQYRQICTVEECLRNKDFLDFLADKMNPNDFETYLSMYNSSGEKQEDERWEN